MSLLFSVSREISNTERAVHKAYDYMCPAEERKGISKVWHFLSDRIRGFSEAFFIAIVAPFKMLASAAKGLTTLLIAVISFDKDKMKEAFTRDFREAYVHFSRLITFTFVALFAIAVPAWIYKKAHEGLNESRDAAKTPEMDTVATLDAQVRGLRPVADKVPELETRRDRLQRELEQARNDLDAATRGAGVTSSQLQAANDLLRQARTDLDTEAGKVRTLTRRLREEEDYAARCENRLRSTRDDLNATKADVENLALAILACSDQRQDSDAQEKTIVMLAHGFNKAFQNAVTVDSNSGDLLITEDNDYTTMIAYYRSLSTYITRQYLGSDKNATNAFNLLTEKMAFLIERMDNEDTNKARLSEELTRNSAYDSGNADQRLEIKDLLEAEYTELYNELLDAETGDSVFAVTRRTALVNKANMTLILMDYVADRVEDIDGDGTRSQPIKNLIKQLEFVLEEVQECQKSDEVTALTGLEAETIASAKQLAARLLDTAKESDRKTQDLIRDTKPIDEVSYVFNQQVKILRKVCIRYALTDVQDQLTSLVQSHRESCDVYTSHYRDFEEVVWTTKTAIERIRNAETALSEIGDESSRESEISRIEGDLNALMQERNQILAPPAPSADSSIPPLSESARQRLDTIETTRQANLERLLQLRSQSDAAKEHHQVIAENRRDSINALIEYPTSLEAKQEALVERITHLETTVLEKHKGELRQLRSELLQAERARDIAAQAILDAAPVAERDLENNEFLKQWRVINTSLNQAKAAHERSSKQIPALQARVATLTPDSHPEHANLAAASEELRRVQTLMQTQAEDVQKITTQLRGLENEETAPSSGVSKAKRYHDLEKPRAEAKLNKSDAEKTIALINQRIEALTTTFEPIKRETEAAISLLRFELAILTDLQRSLIHTLDDSFEKTAREQGALLTKNPRNAELEKEFNSARKSILVWEKLKHDVQEELQRRKEAAEAAAKAAAAAAVSSTTPTASAVPPPAPQQPPRLLGGDSSSAAALSSTTTTTAPPPSGSSAAAAAPVYPLQPPVRFSLTGASSTMLQQVGAGGVPPQMFPPGSADDKKPTTPFDDGYDLLSPPAAAKPPAPPQVPPQLVAAATNVTSTTTTSAAAGGEKPSECTTQ